ncbi:hypothetical protein H9Q09_01030 [Aurantimonas sp. DM33-3]|uniref:hypothetical protein n=1 Tax=Aurantimonas sp. DM33-3 TaxID=2766955 RepID=UPI001651E56D|nr:hypothetical protein [Aurantimonas sp. DM33-3]MBC6714768.1 hypothetical protein [Aurantimonas sp. DM33-3]
MADFQSPTGSPIVGTMERLSGRANITGIDPETRVPEYAGGTDVFWDEAETVERDGEMVFLDEDGVSWVFSQLVMVPVEEQA